MCFFYCFRIVWEGHSGKLRTDQRGHTEADQPNCGGNQGTGPGVGWKDKEVEDGVDPVEGRPTKIVRRYQETDFGPL